MRKLKLSGHGKQSEVHRDDGKGKAVIQESKSVPRDMDVEVNRVGSEYVTLQVECQFGQKQELSLPQGDIHLAAGSLLLQPITFVMQLAATA